MISFCASIIPQNNTVTKLIVKLIIILFTTIVKMMLFVNYLRSVVVSLYPCTTRPDAKPTSTKKPAVTSSPLSNLHSLRKTRRLVRKMRMKNTAG